MIRGNRNEANEPESQPRTSWTGETGSRTSSGNSPLLSTRKNGPVGLYQAQIILHIARPENVHGGAACAFGHSDHLVVRRKAAPADTAPKTNLNATIVSGNSTERPAPGSFAGRTASPSQVVRRYNVAAHDNVAVLTCRSEPAPHFLSICEGPPASAEGPSINCRLQPAYAVTVRVGLEPHSP